MEKKPTPFMKSVPYDFGTRYADMTGAGKCTFIAKVIVCVGTFGFVFPNVQSS